jgi:hypothetical protein
MNILLSYSEELFRNQTNSLVDEFLSFFRLNNLNADKLRIPCKWGEPEKIINQIKIAESIELQNIDKLLTIDFPSLFIRHHNKSVYISDSLVDHFNNRVGEHSVGSQVPSSGEFMEFLLQRIISELRNSNLIILSSKKVAEFLSPHIKIDEKNLINFVSEESFLELLRLQNQAATIKISEYPKLNQLVNFFRDSSRIS